MKRALKLWTKLLLLGLLLSPALVFGQTISAPISNSTGNYTVYWNPELACVGDPETEYSCLWVIEYKNNNYLTEHWTGTSKQFTGKTTGYYKYEYMSIYMVNGEVVAYGPYGSVTVFVAIPTTDVDGDGYYDNVDAVPFNSAEWLDTDHDGVGNNGDTDDDGDGIPDSYESTHGLNSLTYDSHLDYDHDGSTNLQEFQNGTSPSNLLSCSTACLFAPPPGPALISFPQTDATSDIVAAIAGNIDVSNSGAAEYTIPLYVPPGIAGVAPKVALQYRSNGGNGILGEGWSLGALSSIARCPQTPAQDGQALGLALSATDRFCLDGERLVLKNLTDTYGSNGVEYRTETDSFKKIVSYGQYGNGPDYFRVWHKDGSVSEYGNSSDSKANTRFWGSGALSTLIWAQNSIQDALGYATSAQRKVVYTYTNTSIGDTFPYNNYPTDTLKISRIDYGYTSSGALLNSIEFIYEDRIDIREYWVFSQHKFRERKRLNSIKVKARTVTGGNYEEVRAYNFTYLNVAARANKTSKLSAISECRSTVCKPLTQFTWSDEGIDFQLSPSSNVSGFGTFPFATQGIKKFSPADFNADGKTDLVWLEPDGGIYRFRVSLSNGLTLTASTIQSSASHAVDSWTIFDFNQDACPDILFTVNGALRLYANNRVGNVCTLAGTSVELISNMDVHLPSLADADKARSADPKGVFSDVNADGLLDIMYQSSIFYMVDDPAQTNGPYKFVSPNPPYAANRTWGSIFGSVNTYIPIYSQVWFPGQPVYFNLDSAAFPGDFNNDGLPDMVLDLMYDNSGSVFSGDKIVLTQKPDGTFDYVDMFGFYNGGETPAAGSTKVADVNQDGLADFVYKALGSNNVRVALGMGLRNFNLTYGAQGTHLTLPNDDFELADVNNDGLQDFIYRNTVAGDDEIKVLMYTKGVYGDNNNLYITLANVAGDAKGNHLFMDLNGDGILDFVDLASKAYLGNKASGTAWNKITKITNGLGEEINIAYKQLTDSSVYIREYDAPAIDSCYTVQGVTKCYPVFDIFAPITVASSISTSSPIDGNANNLRTTSYQYQGLKVQPGGRGSFGFRKTMVTDNETGNIVTRTFRQDFPFIGLLDSTQTYVSGQGTPLSETVNTYTKLSHINGAVNPPHLVAMTQSVSTQRIPESSPTASSPALTINGVLTTITTSQSNIDSYGNPGTVIVTLTGDGSTHTTTTTNTYSNNATSWILGRRTQAIVARQQGATNTRKTDYTYDTYGRLLSEVREPQGSNLLKLTTSYEYDSFGNPNKITQSSAAGSRYSRTVYDSTGRFVNKTYNGLEQLISEVTQRDVYGNPETVKGLNGVETYARFGTFGRQYFAASNDGMAATTVYRLCSAVACPAGASLRIQTTGVDGSLANVYADKLGRNVRSETKSFSGTLSLVDTQYDSAGRVKKVSVPYFSGSTVYWNTSDYDHLGRLIKVTDATNAVSTNYFSRYVNGTIVGVQQISKNQLNQTKTTITDGKGQSIKVLDNLSGYINYTYDPVGNLTQLNANGVISAISYDLLGRRLTLDDPDQGQWEYLSPLVR